VACAGGAGAGAGGTCSNGERRGATLPLRDAVVHVEACLGELERRPSEDSYQLAYHHGIDAVKLSDGDRRWAAWPFAPIPSGGERSDHGTSLPAAPDAPFEGELSFGMIEIQWTFPPPSSPSSSASGFELEIAEVDALRGVQPWRRVHKGKAKSRRIVCGRAISGVRARVRAYNGNGRGEWSDVSKLVRLPPYVLPERKRIMEMPATWLTIDLAGIEDFNPEAVDGESLEKSRQELLKALYEHRDTIKLAFRYYALAGVSSVDDDPSTMTMVQFGHFCRGAHLLEMTSEHKAITSSDVDRIFLRAVRLLPSTSVAAGESEALFGALSASGIKVSKDWKKVRAAVTTNSLFIRGQNLMSQSQFVGALVRLACYLHPSADACGVPISVGSRLSSLLRGGVHVHVYEELSLLEDEMNIMMRSRLMGAVLEVNHQPLVDIFKAYAAADQSNAATRRLTATMNVHECHQLCSDLHLYDRQFGTRDLLVCFVKVNLDDEIYHQGEACNTPTELVFEEFEEFVARIFKAAVWARVQEVQQSASVLDQVIEGEQRGMIRLSCRG